MLEAFSKILPLVGIAIATGFFILFLTLTSETGSEKYLEATVKSLISTTAILVVIVGIIFTQSTMPSSPIIASEQLGVYNDNDCLETCSSIYWGTLEPASSAERIIYIVNEGSNETVLGLSTDNWNPEIAENYMTLSWNYDNRTLYPNDKAEIVLTLEISIEIQDITDFSFDILITN